MINLWGGLNERRFPGRNGGDHVLNADILLKQYVAHFKVSHEIICHRAW